MTPERSPPSTENVSRLSQSGLANPSSPSNQNSKILNPQSSIQSPQSHPIQRAPHSHRSHAFRHMSRGESPSTKPFAPWHIEIATAFRDHAKAVAFEQYLKSHSGRAFSKTPLLACPGVAQRRRACHGVAQRRRAPRLKLPILPSSRLHRHPPKHRVSVASRPQAPAANELLQPSRQHRECRDFPQPNIARCLKILRPRIQTGLNLRLHVFD